MTKILPILLVLLSIENGVSWGYFDFRRKGDSHVEGFQNPPVD